MSHLKAKMHQIRFRLGLRPRPRWGELTALPQTPYLDLKGPTSKGGGRRGAREGEGRAKEGSERAGQEREEKGGAREREGKGGRGEKGREERERNGGEGKGRRERSPPPPFQIPGSAPVIICTWCSIIAGHPSF